MNMAKRSLEKELQEYKKLENNNRCVFNAADVLQIYHASKQDYFKAINYGLMFGASVGYRTGKRDAKKTAADSKGA